MIDKILEVYRKMVTAIKAEEKTYNTRIEPIQKQQETLETQILALLQQANDVDGLVAFYNNGRDQLDALDNQYKKEKGRIMLRQEKIENTLFAVLKATNSTSIKTAHGTAFTSTQTSVKIADWSIFLRTVVEEALMGATKTDSISKDAEELIDKIMEQEAWSLLKRAASKDAVKAYIEVEKKPVPGVDFDQRLQVSVRRK